MPNRALTVTSTTNFHALGNYVGLAVLGASYFVNPRVQAVDDMLGARASALLMGTMMVGGICAFIVALTAKNRRDPSTSLWIETVLMGVLTFVLGFLVASVIVKYGVVVAMITAVLIGSWLVGCAGRGVQAGRELHRISQARKEPLLTVEVPAEPDKG